MLQCRACHKELSNPAQPCPRCGFVEPAFFGDPLKAEQVINHKADIYRNQYLKDFDFGVIVYRWKDDNGVLALDYTERISFGSGNNLLEKCCWLEQSFARIPDVAKLDIEVSVLFRGTDYRKLVVAVPVPQGNHLQQIGISMKSDMTLQLLLKNPEDQTQSGFVDFLRD